MRYSDQVLARNMLKMRNQRYTIWRHFRLTLKRYILLFSVMGGCCFLLWYIESMTPFYLVLGLFAGCLLRDYGWVTSIGQTWAFTEKITDWEKVEELAE